MLTFVEFAQLVMVCSEVSICWSCLGPQIVHCTCDCLVAPTIWLSFSSWTAFVELQSLLEHFKCGSKCCDTMYSFSIFSDWHELQG